MIIKTGNTGPKVRSDCFVQLQIRNSGGFDIKIISKVAVLYGESIKALCVEVLQFFSIENAKLELVDKGALPWVIIARLEAAIKKEVQTEMVFLPASVFKPSLENTIDRCANLYVSGNTPSMLINAGLHDADVIILDLEDTMPPSKKDEARILVRNAILACDFYNAERMVRINKGERGLDDLLALIPYGVQHVIIPNVESAEMLSTIAQFVAAIKKEHNIEYPIYLMPIVESALGVERAFEIATTSDVVVVMGFDKASYMADIGVQKTKDGRASLFARSRVVNACHAAKVLPINVTSHDVSDAEGLLENVLESKALGFKGMTCIHPTQVGVLKNGFAPTPVEIEYAKQVVFAAQKAKRSGLDEVMLGSKVEDASVLKRQQQTIEVAFKRGLLEEGWEAYMKV